MSGKKNSEFKNQMNDAIRNSSNPWEMQQNIQKQLQTLGVNYSPPVKQASYAQTYEQMPDYDISKLMDKLGEKMPPGIKQMLDQFIPIIPAAGAMDDPKFKKEMKKKMKNLRTMFQSPYE